MTDEPLTDEELSGLVIVSAQQDRSGDSTTWVPDGEKVLRLVAEVRRLRAWAARVKAAYEENAFPEDKEEAIGAVLEDL